MSYLNPIYFAEERATDLEAVESLLVTGDDSAARGHRSARQAHRLLRRRTGSASPRWSLHLPLGQETLARFRDRSRRDRRRGAVLRARAASRGALETEAWHSKRFEMVSLFGLRMPWRASDRAASSAVRAQAEGCTVHDASYLRALLIHGPPCAIDRLLAVVTDAPRSAIRRALRPEGARELHCTLHQPGSWPLGALAPVRVVPCWDASASAVGAAASAPSAATHPVRLLLFVHAAALDQSWRLLQCAAAECSSPPAGQSDASPASSSASADPHPAASIRTSAVPLLRFQVRGPRSHALLVRAFRACEEAGAAGASVQPAGLMSKPTGAVAGASSGHSAEAGDAPISGAAAWAALGSLSSPAPLPHRVILSLSLTPAPDSRGGADPRSDPTSFGAQWSGGGGAETLSGGGLGGPTLRRLLLSWPHQLAATRLLDAVGEGGADGSAAPPNAPAGPLPVMLVQQPPAAARESPASCPTQGGPRGGFGSGWDIIVPAGAGRAVWHALVRNGGRAIGQAELRAVALHEGAPLFPYDWPDTLAGMAQQHDESTARLLAHARRPLARRPNHAALGVVHPFEPCWPSLLPHLFSAAPPSRADAPTASAADGLALDSPCAPAGAAADTEPAEAVPAEPLPSEPLPAAAASHEAALKFCVLRGAVVLAVALPARGAPAPGGQAPGGVLPTASRTAPTPPLVRMPASLRNSLSCSLVRVTLTFCGKGCARAPAAISVPTSSERAAWLANTSKRQPATSAAASAAVSVAAASEASAPAPAAGRREPPSTAGGRLIGFVSNGGYNRLIGSASAIGFCATEPFLELLQGGVSAGAVLVGVRNPTWRHARLALATVVP